MMSTAHTTRTLLAGLAIAVLPAMSASAGGLSPEVGEVTIGSDAQALQAATAANACGERAVVSASYNAAGQVEAICGDVTAFVPLLGGFGPAALGAAALVGVAVLAAGDNGDNANSTTGTN